MDGGGIDAAERVLAARDRFEMGRVHARWVTAEVIELEPIRDRPDHQLISDPVSLLETAPRNMDAPVSERVLRAEPSPAPI
jgi:hypothetical protein